MSYPIVSIEPTPDPDDETASPSIDIGASDMLLEGSIDRINLERCIEQLPAGYRAIFANWTVEAQVSAGRSEQ